MTSHPEIVPWFFGTWIVLGLLSFWFMYLDRNVARKKRLLPIFIIGSGALFVIFVFLISGSLAALAFTFPAAVLICILNLRMIKVCTSCGRTIHSGLWFAKAEYCSKCGARLG
jgi:hypothetical protein